MSMPNDENSRPTDPNGATPPMKTGIARVYQLSGVASAFTYMFTAPQMIPGPSGTLSSNAVLWCSTVLLANVFIQERLLERALALRPRRRDLERINGVSVGAVAAIGSFVGTLFALTISLVAASWPPDSVSEAFFLSALPQLAWVFYMFTARFPDMCIYYEDWFRKNYPPFEEPPVGEAREG